MNWEKELIKRVLSSCDKVQTKLSDDVLQKTINFLQKEASEDIRKKALTLGHIVTTELGLGRTSTTVAILYEMLYEGILSYENIKDEYPATITRLIKGILKVEELYQEQKLINTDVFQKLLLSLAEDVRVILIILSRRLYALRNIETLPKEKQQDIVDELTFIYLPFAHRLGLYNIKMDMEDRILKHNEPDIYNNLVRELRESEAERLLFIEQFIKPINEILKKQNVTYEIKYRTKSIASILGKIRKQGVSLKEVYDVFAIRIILDVPEEYEKMECWRVYSFVSDIYQPNPKRLRDWVTIPKSTGYQSLHTTVKTKENRWVEVQIRTQRMDEIAEKGFAAHWRYKGGKGNKILDDWLLGIREILESEGKGAGEDMMDDMLLELSDKEIYVFTPNGDLKQLPAGATILDFAYSIHGNLGNTCTGGMIGNKNVPIRHKLKSGDEVKIHSAKSQKPSIDWLQFVVTSKAKSHIRQALKAQQAEEASVGKEILMRRLKNWGQEFNDVLMRDLTKHFKIKQESDLYYKIATNKIPISEVKDFLKNLEEKTIGIEETTTNEAIPTSSSKVSDDVLVISDKISGVDFSLAPCCSPVFGDDIFGFVSISRGIKIHRKTCSNAEFMYRKYPYRIVPALWTEQGDSSYIVNLDIQGEDKHGLVNQITDLISSTSKVNLRGISFNSDSGNFSGRVILEIPNKGFLEMITARLLKIKGVKRVQRTN